MQKFFMGVSAILLSFTMVCAVIKETDENQARAEEYAQEEINRIKKMVKPSKVCAIISKDCEYFNDIDSLHPIGIIKANTEVEILQDKSFKYYLVRENEASDEKWVKGEYLIIPDDEETDSSRMSVSDLESYVNIMNFESKTPYFIWVDISRQLTHIFIGEKNSWKLDKTFVCSTGKNVSPTTRGEFEISDRGEWFYSERLQSGAKYFLRFNNSYLFHSLAMDKNKNITDTVLGQRRSSGCVRLSLEDIQYLYNTIPEKTKVFVN